MRHSLRKPSAIISLVLLVACAVFWHRGNRHAEFLRIDAPIKLEVGSMDGELVLSIRQLEAPGPLLFDFSARPDQWKERRYWRLSIDRSPSRQLLHVPRSTETHLRRASFTFWRGDGFLIVAVPFWSAMVVLVIAPLCVWRGTLIRERRRRNALCVQCGYDLRASQDRCPECGTAIPPADENSPKIETTVA
jgi:hypothetical protein